MSPIAWGQPFVVEHFELLSAIVIAEFGRLCVVAPGDVTARATVSPLDPGTGIHYLERLPAG